MNNFFFLLCCKFIGAVDVVKEYFILHKPSFLPFVSLKISQDWQSQLVHFSRFNLLFMETVSRVTKQ